jgi:hypothetical protein
LLVLYFVFYGISTTLQIINKAKTKKSTTLLLDQRKEIDINLRFHNAFPFLLWPGSKSVFDISVFFCFVCSGVTDQVDSLKRAD